MAIVGKWSLNGNSSAQVGDNGAATNITWVDGKQNGAGQFNGSSYISIPSSTTFDFGATYGVEIDIFINSLPTTGNLETLLYRANSSVTGAQFELVLYNDGGIQKIFISQATTFNPINYTLPTGRWIKLAVSYSSNVISFYLDGNLIGSVSQSTQCGTSNKELNIGRNSASGGIRYFTGKVDELTISNTAFNQSELKNKYLLYNGFI